MNFRVILNTLGWVLNCEGVCMLLPWICAIIYHEAEVYTFLICIAMCLFFGTLLVSIKPKNRNMYAREGFIIAATTWILISIFGAVPYLLSGSITSFIDALFETASGFTTTGASIISDLDSIPRSILMWRSFTHWIGGMGVLVFLIVFLPLSGGNNVYIIKAESPGPSVSKLVPKVRTTAKILYSIYLGMTIIQIIILLLSGMELFDAVTLTFGTAGTGGFSIRNSGLADYTSLQQIVITIFMILFGVDFTFYYLLLKKDIKSALKMEEVRTYIGVIFTAIVLISINCFRLYPTLFDNIRHTAFQVSSIITTTGYSTVDFDLWLEFSKVILVLLMFIGACAGSTGGGIKFSRIIIFIKSIFKEIKLAARPNTTYKVKFNQKPVKHEVIRIINVYMASYIIIFFTSVLIVSIDNFDFTTNYTAVVATLNNIGPGLSGVGPVKNFSIYSPLSKIVLTIDMLIGRLEIFPFLILLSPHTWKK